MRVDLYRRIARLEITAVSLKVFFVLPAVKTVETLSSPCSGWILAANDMAIRVVRIGAGHPAEDVLFTLLKRLVFTHVIMGPPIGGQ